MGEFVNNSDNIAEELLKIVPISYFVTEDFQQKCKENGFSGRWSMCNTMVTFKGTNILVPTKERINLVLEKFCQELIENSNRTLYNFISIVIKGYCNYEQTTVDLSSLRILLRSLGVIKITELEQYDSNAPFTQNIIIEINKWDEIKDIVAKLESDCVKATEADDFSNVGNTCRHLLIQLAQLVYDPKIHGDISDKGPKIGKAHVLEMLSKFIAFKLSGSSNEEFRAYANSTINIANALTHKTHATKKEMLLTASAVINLVYVIGIVGDKFNDETFA